MKQLPLCLQNYTEGGEQERVNASVLSENSVVSVSVGENNSSSSRQVSNGAPETCGLFQKHSKYSSSSTTYASGGGGVNAQIQNRSASSSSKYSVSTTDVEKREVNLCKSFNISNISDNPISVSNFYVYFCLFVDISDWIEIFP